MDEALSQTTTSARRKREIYSGEREGGRERVCVGGGGEVTGSYSVCVRVCGTAN